MPITVEDRLWKKNGAKIRTMTPRRIKRRRRAENANAAQKTSMQRKKTKRMPPMQRRIHGRRHTENAKTTQKMSTQRKKFAAGVKHKSPLQRKKSRCNAKNAAAATQKMPAPYIWVKNRLIYYSSIHHHYNFTLLPPSPFPTVFKYHRRLLGTTTHKRSCPSLRLSVPPFFRPSMNYSFFKKMEIEVFEWNELQWMTMK